MTADGLLDVISAALLLAGSVLTLAAAVGILRFADVLSRMHAATKPQVTGILLIVTATAIQLRGSVDVWMLVLVVVFQLLTAPVAAHLVGRLAYKSGGVRADRLVVNDLEAEPPPS